MVCVLVAVGGTIAAGCSGGPKTSQAELRADAKGSDEPKGVSEGDASKLLPWKQPKLPPHRDWQLAVADLPESDSRITYLVPYEWDVDSHGRATGPNGLVKASVTMTPLTDADTTLVDYVERLADGEPVYVRKTPDGDTTLLTMRDVSVAPADPAAAKRTFHTVAVRVDGHIAKLEVSYDAAVRWRFSDVANAIIGTLAVVHPES